MVFICVLAAATRASAGTHCHETSRIVGRERCAWFGDRWAHRWIEELEFGFMDSALIFEHVAIPSAPRGELPSTVWTTGYRAGLRWHGPHAIAGLELGGAGSTTRPAYASVLDLAAYGGIHERVGILDFASLLVVGHRAVRADLELPASHVLSDQLLVEVRGGVDMWVGRYVTLGVSAGIDVAVRAESVAVELHLHLAPFDGS